MWNYIIRCVCFQVDYLGVCATEMGLLSCQSNACSVSNIDLTKMLCKPGGIYLLWLHDMSFLVRGHLVSLEVSDLVARVSSCICLRLMYQLQKSTFCLCVCVFIKDFTPSKLVTGQNGAVFYRLELRAFLRFNRSLNNIPLS